MVATNPEMSMSLRQPLRMKLRPSSTRPTSSRKSCHCAARPSVHVSHDAGDLECILESFVDIRRLPHGAGLQGPDSCVAVATVAEDAASGYGDDNVSQGSG